ncbi:cilia- and flagella-associated protein 52 [Diachasma alloeum]|uniref:cilia- and flagella-associated protein 52 n=1 Tax=Diachasma alloeum TaxID=454923 RepID=UPI00073832D6|nr:cilia- and flagella-associated protein 52 [Diachasma alloeum]
MDVQELNILGIIGFDGRTKNALHMHPDGKHLIYSMGSKVTVRNVDSGHQEFLAGHTNVVTTLSISRCGSFIASGQLTHLGFKAAVIIWDFDGKKRRGSYEIHKAKVEDVCFTCEGTYLISLGGKDDGNIVVWDVCNNSAVCGAYASTEITGTAITLATLNHRNQCFVTGGEENLKVWRINPETRKVYGVPIKVGKLRRSINCITIDDKDEEAYCGTSTGDIIRARLNYDTDLSRMEPVQPPVMIGCYSKISTNPKKLKMGTGDLYSGGVTNVVILPGRKIIVATGDGTVELAGVLEHPSSPSCKEAVKLPTTPQLRPMMKARVGGSVTSIVRHGKNSFVVGTSFCEIYQICLTDFSPRITLTCHIDAVYDIAFPHNYSEIFATGSKNDIRLWHLDTRKELLRITVPNFVCTCLCFSYDGKLIMSAWNDGIVRAFRPQSGKLFFAIENAHVKAVSALCLTKDGKTLVTGGCDGQVRFWRILKNVQQLRALLKEHRGPITALHASQSDEEVVSSSTDGTCIIWDVMNCCRKQVMMGNTMHMSARFHPSGLQILTCGSDRKISYWETLDGSLIRETEGSTVGALNCLDISPDGRYFVTGGSDCLLKFWDYHTAEVTYVGTGHAAIITACKFDSKGTHIVSASADGAVIIWRSPIALSLDSAKSSKHSRASRCSRESREVREENIDKISQRSGDESVRTVHESKHSEVCEYDPIRPAQDSCRCREEKQAPVNQEHSPLKRNESLGEANGQRRLEKSELCLAITGAQ